MAARAPASILPPGLVQRGLTRLQAAVYVGSPVEQFDRLVAHGLYPQAMPSGAWDLKALDAALDRLSGLVEPAPRDLEGLARSRIHEVGPQIRHRPAKR